ncbi:MAG: Methyltransferase domain [Acidobacteriota bacterium]|jgi:SAM-dependent methyltransferase|nr:Methyltransferase domain [Acidobacteriota bacterium]
MWNLISTRVTQFAYFDQQLKSPVWKGRKVLDFGGNVGTFLRGAGNSVDHDDYWCIDLNQVVIEQGQRQFPRAHFVHYDRYSSEFNPNGVRYLPIPDCGLKFDIILAFSVFTHVHQDELLELVGQLQSLLAPSGVLAFTFCDPSYDRSLLDPTLPSGTDVRKNLEWRRVKNLPCDIDEIVERASKSKWCVLIDEELYVEPGHELSNQERRDQTWESYCSFFAADYMRSLFPEAKILPPVSPEWQHCCIIRKA